MTQPEEELWESVQRAQDRVDRAELDRSLIESNLALTPRERLERNERAGTLLRSLRDAAAKGSDREP